jgi:hypothetical protein
MKQCFLALLFPVTAHAQLPVSIINCADSITTTDTLVITAFIPDLGEWGGHKEHIYFHRYRNGVLMFRHRVEDTCCFPSLKIHNEPEKNYYGVCTRNAIAHVKTFLAALNTYDLKKEDAYNASYYFELRFRGRLLGKWQAYSTWKAYEKMRKQVTGR